ncbi:MAG TPA: ABC transporter permease [Candidatus Angelobacter sp.]
MGTVLQDLKYGLRIHTKTFGLTAIAIVTLAMGIGACTAVFGVVDAILLRPLPYSDSEKIAIPWRLVPKGVELGYDKIPWGARDFRLFLQESKTFQDLGAFKSQPFTWTGVEEPTLLEGLQASAGFFSVLGVSPVLGRTFTAEEDQVGHGHVLILSFDLWQERYAGSEYVLGRAMELNGDAYTVIGVMPQGFAFPHANEMPGSFQFPHEAQLWVPLALPPTSTPGESDELAIFGRLKPGVSMDDVQAEMDVFAKREDSEYPKAKGWFNSRVMPLKTQIVGDTRVPLLLMLGAVGTVLLIACSNVASLLLARSLVRRREFTVRAALGAGQHRLVRQVLTESLLLATTAGAAGVGLGEAGIFLVKLFGPANIPRLQEASLDLRVFAFALSITIVTGILFGLAPAAGAIRKNLFESLKEGGQRTGGSPTNPRLRKILIVSQAALALVLLIAAGLVTKTFYRLLSVEKGFNAGQVLTFEVSLLNTKYTDNDKIVLLYDKLLQQMREVPGVKAAGIAGIVPMAGAPESTVIRIPGRPTVNDKEKPYASYTITSPGYFSALGTPLLRGRDFQDSDRGDSLPVAIINNAMARKFWPEGDAIGQQVGLGSLRYPPMAIVGIVADVKHISFREDVGPEMYVPYTQKPWPSMLRMQVAARTLADPTSVTGSVRAAIRSVDPDLPMAKVATLATLADNSMAQPRFAMLLLGCFGALALVLASVGMYGVISYSVTQRTQEFGIRMALGAERWDIFRMVLGQGGRLAGLGVIIGLLTALLTTQLMEGYLYGVHPIDPLVYGLAISSLLVVLSLFACYMPARRATRVDPMVALRDE